MESFSIWARCSAVRGRRRRSRRGGRRRRRGGAGLAAARAAASASAASAAAFAALAGLALPALPALALPALGGRGLLAHAIVPLDGAKARALFRLDRSSHKTGAEMKAPARLFANAARPSRLRGFWPAPAACAADAACVGNPFADATIDPASPVAAEVAKLATPNAPLPDASRRSRPCRRTCGRRAQYGVAAAETVKAATTLDRARPSPTPGRCRPTPTSLRRPGPARRPGPELAPRRPGGDRGLRPRAAQASYPASAAQEIGACGG